MTIRKRGFLLNLKLVINTTLLWLNIVYAKSIIYNMAVSKYIYANA